MLLTKEVEVILHNKTIQHFEEKGYEIPRYKDKEYRWLVKRGTKIAVNVEDLTEGSGINVEIMCDQCKKKYFKQFRDYLKENRKNGCNICIECLNKNMPINISKKYGVKNVSSLKWVQEKKKETMLKRLGVEYTSQSPQVKEKIKQTSLKRFDVEYILQSPEIREKIKKTNMERYNVEYYTQTDKMKQMNLGDKNINWKGGITPKNTKIRESIEYKQWRKSIFEKDDYTCQVCGERGGKLQAHHLENFADNPDLRFNIENGITTCFNCHHPSIKGSFHNIYGSRNNTRQQFEEYTVKYKEGERHDLL